MFFFWQCIVLWKHTAISTFLCHHHFRNPVNLCLKCHPSFSMLENKFVIIAAIIKKKKVIVLLALIQNQWSIITICWALNITINKIIQTIVYHENVITSMRKVARVWGDYRKESYTIFAITTCLVFHEDRGCAPQKESYCVSCIKICS